ncbi:hypothetical protein [Hydrogenophaga sp.]|uniref:hypothetical protein n=1 Tax=Hydrogenophaga sp. TaxID=1904254 RepID=UPI003F6CD026
MINISTNHTVSWPQPVSPAVPAVSAVTAVKPAQEGRQEGQASLGGGREGASAQAQRREGGRSAGVEVSVSPEAAPLLPREAAQSAAPALSEASVKTEQAAAKQQAEPAEQAQKAEEQSKKLQLQAVLTNVWQASAAVVDHVLGRTAALDADLPGNQSDTSPSLGVLSAMQAPRKMAAPERETERAAQAPRETLPWPVMPEGSAQAEALLADVDPRPLQEVVAYDENGNSSLAPLEAGSLVSERV